MKKSVVISKERMKNMEKPKYEIIVFDEADIMTASKLDIDPNIEDSSTPILWLDRASAYYYNNLIQGDTDFYLDELSDDVEYVGFTGSKMMGYYVVVDTKPIDDIPEHVNRMVGNIDDEEKVSYDMIFDWLSSHKKN